MTTAAQFREIAPLLEAIGQPGMAQDAREIAAELERNRGVGHVHDLGVTIEEDTYASAERPWFILDCCREIISGHGFASRREASDYATLLGYWVRRG